jgi:hypothetical protein
MARKKERKLFYDPLCIGDFTAAPQSVGLIFLRGFNGLTHHSFSTGDIF